MSIQTVLKLSCIGVVSFGLSACGSMPSMDGVFVDQKESYKRAHELPSLEMPPELTAGQTQDEYDGGVRGTVSVAKKNAVVQTPALIDEAPTTAKIVLVGNASYLLVHDGFRNTWRKTLGALEALAYDVEDKNRDDGVIYLNISDGESKLGMLPSLAFWKSSSASVYLVSFDEYSDGVAVEVQNKDGVPVNDEVSKKIYADLLRKLTQ